VGSHAIDDLRALAARDGELSARVARLTEIDARCAGIRTRAEEIDAFFARYPEEDMRRRRAVADARAELEVRRSEHHEAEVELGRARDEEAKAYALRALERAADHIRVAEAALERAEQEHGALEVEAAELPAEVPQLERRARAVADGMPEAPRPGEGLRALVEWASRVHAALFVESRQLASQRELVIREANELASSVLGEPTYGSTVEQVLARVAAH
jgi:chromosome segregation ATPase